MWNIYVTIKCYLHFIPFLFFLLFPIPSLKITKNAYLLWPMHILSNLCHIPCTAGWLTLFFTHAHTHTHIHVQALVCPHCCKSLIFSFNYQQWAAEKVSVAPVTLTEVGAVLNKTLVSVCVWVHRMCVRVCEFTIQGQRPAESWSHKDVFDPH